MSEEQMIADAVWQIVQYARTIRLVAGSDWAEIDAHLDRFALEENAQRWAHGPPASAVYVDPTERFRLSTGALKRAVQAARVEFGLV